jgi:hypothetical protein
MTEAPSRFTLGRHPNPEAVTVSDEYTTKSDGEAFSPEDQYRINRLYEEIQGRIEELAMITARAAGIPLTDDTVRKFEPKPLPSDSYEVDVEIICPPEGLGPCACVYRRPDGTWDWERPCGSGHH